MSLLRRRVLLGKRRKKMKKWHLPPIICLKKKIILTWVKWRIPRNSIQPTLLSPRRERRRTRNYLTFMGTPNLIRSKWWWMMTSKRIRSRRSNPDRKSPQSLISTSSTTLSCPRRTWTWEAQERSGRTIPSTIPLRTDSLLGMKMMRRTSSTINLPRNRSMRFSNNSMLSTRKTLIISLRIRENSSKENWRNFSRKRKKRKMRMVMRMMRGCRSLDRSISLKTLFLRGMRSLNPQTYLIKKRIYSLRKKKNPSWMRRSLQLRLMKRTNLKMIMTRKSLLRKHPSWIKKNQMMLMLLRDPSSMWLLKSTNPDSPPTWEWLLRMKSRMSRKKWRWILSSSRPCSSN